MIAKVNIYGKIVEGKKIEVKDGILFVDGVLRGPVIPNDLKKGTSTIEVISGKVISENPNHFIVIEDGK